MGFPTIAWHEIPKLSISQMNQLVMLGTGKYGLDQRLLVEHTGRNLVALVDAFAPDGPILVVAGRGNNGSGGLAAARLLATLGRRIWVIPTHEVGNYSGTPREQLEHLEHFDNVRIKSSMPKMKYACVIDAAIGTRLEGPPRGRTLDTITVLNNLHDGCCVISVDVPTGVVADTGEVPGDAVQATMTLAVGLPKVGLEPGGHVGRLFVGAIGLPGAVFDDVGIDAVKLPGFVTEVLADG